MDCRWLLVRVWSLGDPWLTQIPLIIQWESSRVFVLDLLCWYPSSQRSFITNKTRPADSRVCRTEICLSIAMAHWCSYCRSSSSSCCATFASMNDKSWPAYATAIFPWFISSFSSFSSSHSSSPFLCCRSRKDSVNNTSTLDGLDADLTDWWLVTGINGDEVSFCSFAAVVAEAKDRKGKGSNCSA